MIGDRARRGEVFAAKADALRSIPGINAMERQNQLLKVIHDLHTCMCHVMLHTTMHMYTYIN